jgi:hypothetical protein
MRSCTTLLAVLPISIAVCALTACGLAEVTTTGAAAVQQDAASAAEAARIEAQARAKLNAAQELATRQRNDADRINDESRPTTP